MAPRIPLSELRPGEPASVTQVEGPEPLRLRLAALGFRAGRAVLVLRQAGLGGPLHVRLGTTDVALRPKDAAGIAVSRAGEAEP